MREKSAVVIIAVWLEKRLVLVVKKGEELWSELSRRWVLPAETLEFGETGIDAVHRGLAEEAHLEVGEPTQLAESRSYGGTVINWYSCVAQNPEDIQPGSDAKKVAWRRPQEVLSMYGNLPSHPLPDAIKEFLKTV